MHHSSHDSENYLFIFRRNSERTRRLGPRRNVSLRRVRFRRDRGWFSGLSFDESTDGKPAVERVAARGGQRRDIPHGRPIVCFDFARH